MPPPICPKCRHSAALEGDLWCAGCTGWEAAGRELCAHWDIPGAKVLANDLILNIGRQIRALRSLSAGVAVGGGLSGSAGASRARSVRPGSERAETPGRAADRSRESLPRRQPELPTPPPPPAPNKEEPTEEASGDWEGEEEEELEDEEVVVREELNLSARLLTGPAQVTEGVRLLQDGIGRVLAIAVHLVAALVDEGTVIEIEIDEERKRIEERGEITNACTAWQRTPIPEFIEKLDLVCWNFHQWHKDDRPWTGLDKQWRLSAAKEPRSRQKIGCNGPNCHQSEDKFWKFSCPRQTLTILRLLGQHF